MPHRPFFSEQQSMRCKLVTPVWASQLCFIPHVGVSVVQEKGRARLNKAFSFQGNLSQG